MANKKLSDLKFDDKNFNKGSEKGNRLLEKSLREGGTGRSILIDKNGVIIAGNQTAAKAGELGIEDVIIVPTDGKSIVAVQRTDIDINTPEGAKLKILDNTVSKHNYVEDAEVMEAVCEEYELEPDEYGMSTPFKMEMPSDDELIGEEKNKPPVMKITFDSPEQLQAAENDIRELLDRKYSGAYYSVSAGEI